MKRALLKTIYRAGGFAPFRWANRGRALILTYHRFSEDTHAFRNSAAEFEAHLEYLKKHNNVLPLTELVRALEEGQAMPANPVAITIDDGYADAYEVALPLLKKYGFPATIFAITDFVEGRIWLWTDKMRYVLEETKGDFLRVSFEKYDTIEEPLSGSSLQRLKLADRVNSILKKLPNEEKEAKILEIAGKLDVLIPAAPVAEYAAMTWEMARELDKNGVRVESHTVTHPMLTRVDQRQVEFELRDSKRRLEKELGRVVEVFCYPSGAFDEDVRRAAVTAGYQHAVTTRYGFTGVGDDKFLLKRIDAQFDITEFAQSVSGFEAFRQKFQR